MSAEISPSADRQALINPSLPPRPAGKSTVINLLVQTWRSRGKRVIVTAASAKAARLIGGHTVHAAFKLRSSGGFLRAQLGTEHHSSRLHTPSAAL